MPEPSLSVAMCTFNGAKFLSEQLASIANQHRLPDELVICDDGSTDDTLDIIEAFTIQAPFQVKLFINRERLGSTKNFENAIRYCSGQIIALSDQDDVWHSEKLKSIETAFSESTMIGVLFSDALIVDQYLHPLGYNLWQAINFNRTEQALVLKGKAFEVQLKHFIVTGATMAFRAGFRDLIFPIPPGWFHDAWIALLISFIAETTIIREPLIKYRQYSGQQIGMKKKFFSEKIMAAKHASSPSYYNMAGLYTAAYNRLRNIMNGSQGEEKLTQLQRKITHLNVRAEIHSPLRKTSRFRLVCSEFLNLRYHRYSNGFRSFCKDLFLRTNLSDNLATTNK